MNNNETWGQAVKAVFEALRKAVTEPFGPSAATTAPTGAAAATTPAAASTPRAASKKSGGLDNPYSKTLLDIMVTAFIIGSAFLWYGWIVVGAFFYAITAMLASGFKMLGTAPREVAVISYFGHRTNFKAEGLTLACEPFGIKIVSLTVFAIKNEDLVFTITSARCGDGVRMAGSVNMTVLPDDKDDSADMRNGRNGAQKLWDYWDMGQAAGVYAQNEEIVIVGIQDIIEPTSCTWEWAETHPTAIGVELLEKMKAAKTVVRIVANSDRDTEDGIADIAGLGFRIKKLQVKLTPSNPEVIKADEDNAVEVLERKAEQRDTETIDIQAEERLNMYRRLGMPGVTIQACRGEVFNERLAKDKKVTINQGSKVVRLKTS